MTIRFDNFNYNNFYREIKYFDSLNDIKLLDLLDELPNYSKKYDDLIKKVKLFLETVDLVSINNEALHSLCKTIYEGAKNRIEAHTKAIKTMKIKNKKASFLKKRSNNKAIEAQTVIINDLTEKIIKPFEKDKVFSWEYILETNDQPWGIIRGYSENYDRYFKNALHNIYLKKINEFKDSFKRIFYNFEEIEVFLKNHDPNNMFDFWERTTADDKKLPENVGIVHKKNKDFKFAFRFKTYTYRKDWDFFYYPYFLGETFRHSHKKLIPIIEQILLSRHHGKMIDILKRELRN